jgi:hypothetical protein
VALELTPLESLAPSIEKVAGASAPAPLKMMAARGLAPLKPFELLTALYQLVVTSEEALRAAALKSATDVREKMLAGGLAEPLDPRVLDFFARRVWQKPKQIETILLNRATADETFRHLATLCGEVELEMIAKNEARLLRHPEIIAALYLNPKTRMSTAQRALELAVRNGVKVEGIPAFEEVVKALEQPATPEQAQREDEAFKRAAEVAIDADAGLSLSVVDHEEAAKLAAEEAARADALASGELPPEAKPEEVEEKKKRLTDLSPAAQIRAATLGNSFARAVLIRSKNKQVAIACIRSPGVSDPEAIHYAANRSLDEEIIRYVAAKRQWTRLYGIKVALCNNPKCPLPTAMSFLPHLRPPELKALARSKGIPTALANAAKQLLRARSGDQ